MEPLEEAQCKVVILENKLQRREDMIRQLRRYISLELVQIKLHGPEDARQKYIESYKEEALRIVSLRDDISKLQTTIESRNSEISKLKSIIAYQADKAKRLIANEDKIAFTYREKLRKVEKERNLFKNSLQTLSAEIDAQKLEKEELTKKLLASKAAEHSSTFEMETNEKLLQSVRQTLAGVKSERDKAVKAMLEAAYDWDSLNEEVSSLKKENKLLSTK